MLAHWAKKEQEIVRIGPKTKNRDFLEPTRIRDPHCWNAGRDVIDYAAILYRIFTIYYFIYFTVSVDAGIESRTSAEIALTQFKLLTMFANWAEKEQEIVRIGRNE